MRSFNFCSYIMKFLRLTLVAPGGTLIQFGETSFTREDRKFKAQEKKPLLHGSFRISHFVLFRISDFGQRQIPTNIYLIVNNKTDST